jgi:hypothetical protein
MRYEMEDHEDQGKLNDCKNNEDNGSCWIDDGDECWLARHDGAAVGGQFVFT